jgi:hypothetical protein
MTACTNQKPLPASERQITALAASIRAMSPQVDPAEAIRAAQLSYQTAFQLAQAYQITDPPLIHNTKVNAGTRPRGLCYHWAEDMQARLQSEGFATLDIARAIANAQSLFLIEHSTAVITPKGAPMADGIVIDPWRKGGTLFWSSVRKDTRYPWLPRAEVMRAKGKIRYVQRTEGSLAPPPIE